MTIRTALARIWSSVVIKATEGQYRPGAWRLPVSGGWLSSDAPSWGNYWNWWQLGGSIIGQSSRSAMVEACVSAYAQTVAMCPGDHWRGLKNNGRERVTNSALSRILRHPNDYQSISDFMLNATRSLYLDGNAYALALRNDRYEIDELHLMDPNQSSPQVMRANGEDGAGQVFYRLGGNDIISQRFTNLPGDLRSEQLLVPQRDVLHIRLHCFERTRWPFPLIGETPLTAAYPDIAYYEQMKNQQEQFLNNRAAPSAVLTTDLSLDSNQVQALRDRWNEQAKGLHAGGVPILTHGLKVHPWTEPKTAKDMQIAEIMKLTDDHIALVFRVPLAILGVLRASAGTTEQLMGIWLATGLGFCLNHIEEAFGCLFNLKGVPDEYVEFDTEALLRSAQKDRIDMLKSGVQGGIYSPNEARALIDLPEVEYGDEPRVQQQVVPLSAAAAIPMGSPGAFGTSSTPIPAAPAAPAQPAAAAITTESASKSTFVMLNEHNNAEREYAVRLINQRAAINRRVA